MITAVILAAGESRRMGRPKMLLPWGQTSVLGQVVSNFRSAGVEDLLVVTGGARAQVEALTGGVARTVFNPDYTRGEMLSSVQCGLRNLPPDCEASLIALGDQPFVKTSSVRKVINAYAVNRTTLVAPSYQRRRGHPWLVTAQHWPEIIGMRTPLTLRDFLINHQDEILYVNVDDPGILMDLDTPDDYAKYLKAHG